MPAPRNPPVPRFAPQNSITLITALDIYGRAVDPTWTGEEVKADTAPEPSDGHLANLAFARVTREAADNPRGEVGVENPSEQQILAALQEFFMSTGMVTPLRHRMIEDMNARKL